MQWISALFVFGAVTAQTAAFKTTPPTWELEVTPGGEKVTLNGTVQDVHKQLLKLNPNYETDFPRQNVARGSFLKRGKSHKIECDGVMQAASDAIDDGIDYLNRIGGTPGQDGHSCGRVSCSYNSAIYMCNYNVEKHYLKSFATLGTGAQWIVDDCTNGGSVGGKMIDSDNWGVEITGADTC